ncbi:MAG: MBG domain-containing protein, partial [Thermoleophilia bacterium]
PLTVTASSPTVTYGDAIPTISPAYLGFVNSDSASVISGTTCATAYVRTSAVATTPAATCSSATAANYSFTYTPGAVTIQRALLTVTASSPNVTYGDPIPDVTPSYVGFVNGDAASVLATDPMCSTAYTRRSVVATTPTTSCALAADENYAFAYVAAHVTVQRAPVMVTASSPTVTYGDATPTITPNYAGFVNSEGASVVTGTSCSTAYVPTSVVVSTPATSCVGAAASNYSFSYATGAVSIERAPLTVTASSPTVTYGDAIPAVSPQYAGWVNAQNASALTTVPTCTTTYLATAVVASSPSTSCDTGAAANYVLSYVVGHVTIERAMLQVRAVVKWKRINTLDPALTATVTGLVNSDTIDDFTAPVRLGRVAGETAGTYTITPSAAVAANYAFTYHTNVLTIEGRIVPTITWATPAAMVYEMPLSATQLNATAADGGTPVAGVFAYSEAASPRQEGDVLGAGTHSLSVTFTPTNAVDYAGNSASVTLLINKAPQLIVAGAVAATRTYGQSTTLTASSYSGTGAITYTVASGPCTNAGATLTTTGAGTCQVTASIATDANYLAAASTQLSVTVNPATLTVTAVNKSRRRAVADPALTYLITGYVGTDDESVLTAPVALTRAPGEAPGPYAITGSGAVATNYVFSYTPGVFTIVEKELAVLTWAAPAAITYGTVLSATQLSPSAAIRGVDIPGAYSFAIGGSPVMDGTLLPAGAYVITATFVPTDLENITSGTTAQVALTVARKTLTVSGITAADKPFDTLTTVVLDTTAAAPVGVVGIDDVGIDVSNAVGTHRDAAPGAGKVLDISGLDTTGVSRINYTLTQPTATATIRAVVPGTPTGVTAVAMDRQASVEWAAPAFNGGQPITGYTVTASPGGQTCTWTAGPYTCTVTGLTNNTTYTFTVSATNAAGTSSASSTSGPTTPTVAAVATISAAFDAGMEVIEDGTARVSLGCGSLAATCKIKSSMYIGTKLIDTTEVDVPTGGSSMIILQLPPKIQRQLAEAGVLTVNVVTIIQIDTSVIKMESSIQLEAPPATAIQDATLNPTADGSSDFKAKCIGTMVTRCTGTIALYATESTLRAAKGRAVKKILLGTGPIGTAAGDKITSRVALNKEGQKLLKSGATIEVIPAIVPNGKTSFDGKLPNFSMSMMSAKQWLRRALDTLQVGGKPRLDLNLLLDSLSSGKTTRADAVRLIEREIIPRREQARAKVEALPIPPGKLRPIATLLLRAFDQSLAANHAYVDWLQSGAAEDTQGWRYSKKASATKAKLISLLAKIGRANGVKVPPATGLWP